MGECWLELLSVDAIWPLRGVANSKPLDEIRDVSQAAVIGCRVAAGLNTYDLAVSHDELAEAVRMARVEDHRRGSRWPVPGSP